MKDRWKLKHTFYCYFDYDLVEIYKVNEDYKLLARKGQIAERHELTEELREEFGIYEECWKTIYIFKNGNFILSQDEFSNDFEALKIRRNYERNYNKTKHFKKVG